MAQTVQKKTIIVYIDENDNEPYADWLESFKDKKTQEPYQGTYSTA